MSATFRGLLAGQLGFLLLSLSSRGLAQQPATQPPSLEAVVRASVAEGVRIDVLNDRQVAATADADTTVLFTAVSTKGACPSSPAPFWTPWRAETVEAVHQSGEHAFTTCSTTTLGLLKVHATYKDDSPEANPPQALVVVVRSVLKQTAPPEAAPPEQEADTGDQIAPEPPGGLAGGDEADGSPASAKKDSVFLRANIGGLYEHHTAAGGDSAGAGGFESVLTGLFGSFGVDFALRLAFDGRSVDLGDSRLVGFTYDIRLGAAVGAHGQAGSIGVAVGAGSDAVSSPRFEDRPNVPPAGYLYASPFIHARLSRCFVPEAEGTFALRSSYSHGLRVRGALGIGCFGDEKDTTGRAVIGGYWQHYPDRELTGLGVMFGMQLVTN